MLTCTFEMRPSTMKVVQKVAEESSTGTWIDIPNTPKKLTTKVKSARGKTTIAYPDDLFEPGNLPQLLSSLAGNIFGMKIVKSLRLLDIEFPKKYAHAFLGPKFGIKGIRKITKINSRPILGSIIKPKIGLSANQHANLAYKCWIGGIDLVKDDENLTSMKFNKFKERVVQTLKARDHAEKETGQRKFYLPNITAETREMLRRAKFVKSHSGEYIMIDILSVGWSAFQTIRNTNLNLIIHAHRAGHAILSRGPFGLSMLVIAKLARLVGADQLHTGALIGKMESKDTQEVNHFLRSKWYKNTVMPVASGGLYPAQMPELLKLFGKDIILQFGGGLHAHPQGPIAGAIAIRQALTSALKNKKQNYSELQEALKYFKSN